MSVNYEVVNKISDAMQTYADTIAVIVLNAAQGEIPKELNDSLLKVALDLLDTSLVVVSIFDEKEKRENG